MQRKLDDVKKIVVKIGTKVLLNNEEFEYNKIDKLVDDIIYLKSEKNIDIVIVSSGAVGLAMKKLNLSKRPAELKEVQALAAIGQTLLMDKWREVFAKKNLEIAQILLTHDVLTNRRRAIYAIDTINTLLKKFNAIPIINENDTIAIDEIMFGDNDYLSAIVSNLIGADLLVLYSDIDGLFDKNPHIYPNAKLIKYVSKINDDVFSFIEDKKNNFSKGGMYSKLMAAKEATKAGTHVVLANGMCDFKLREIVEGNEIGTYFSAMPKKISAKKRWILANRKVKGKLYIDNGAKNAILNLKKSLLIPGIKKVEGVFNEGDIVNILDEKGQLIAKGVAYYSSKTLEQIIGKEKEAIKDMVEKFREEVIDRDNMIIMEEENE